MSGLCYEKREASMKNKINRIFLSALVLSLLVFATPMSGICQLKVRTEPKIPDISGYVTLKCDFHMHTVFSDGTVWPHIRSDEVWREGLDAFSITDHIEYLPHKDDIKKDHNRSYELVRGSAAGLNLILIRGTEITRDMPPGHLNAVFIKDANPIDTESYKDALRIAFEQGAFIFWNHPPFPNPKGIAEWFPEHTEIYEKGWMHGIEVVNGRSYYPKAHLWCLEKKLTMIGTSDVHNPINLDYDIRKGDHRPMTLVFAKERNRDELKKALFKRRTVVYHGNMLIGEEQYLKPIFNNSIEIINPEVTINGKSSTAIQIRNNSDISYKLTADGESEFISAPKNITLHAGKVVLFGIKGKKENISAKKLVRLPYRIKNLLIKPETGLPVKLKIGVNLRPADRR